MNSGESKVRNSIPTLLSLLHLIFPTTLSSKTLVGISTKQFVRHIRCDEKKGISNDATEAGYIKSIAAMRGNRHPFRSACDRCSSDWMLGIGACIHHSRPTAYQQSSDHWHSSLYIPLFYHHGSHLWWNTRQARA
jgi:hypothetical protein